MKLVTGVLFILLSIIFSPAYADNTVTVKATEGSNSDNLDLQAVGSLFGKSKSLEDFENQLNNPDLGISNLDLNKDGQVDYLRVVEVAKGNVHQIILQAVTGENQFQDVATIEVEKNSEEEVTVQIIGDAGIYGENYIIEPTYAIPPVLPLLFWASHHRPWRSPFRWGHYPNHYRPWRPYPLALYQSRIRVQINTGDTDDYFKKSRGEITINSQKKEAPNSKTYSTRPAENNLHNNQGNNNILSTKPRQ